MHSGKSDALEHGSTLHVTRMPFVIAHGIDDGFRGNGDNDSRLGLTVRLPSRICSAISVKNVRTELEITAKAFGSVGYEGRMRKHNKCRQQMSNVDKGSKHY
jgi:hypothetical protein